MLTFSVSFFVYLFCCALYLISYFPLCMSSLLMVFSSGTYTTWYLKFTILLQFVFLSNKPCTLNRIATLYISHLTLEVIISSFSAFHSPTLETCLSQLFSSWSLFSLSLRFCFLFLLYHYSLPIRSISHGLRFPYFLLEYPAYITLEKWSSNSTFMVSCFTPPPADSSHQSGSVLWLCPPFWICLGFHHSLTCSPSYITFRCPPALSFCLTDLCLGAFLMVFPLRLLFGRNSCSLIKLTSCMSLSEHLLIEFTSHQDLP